MARFREWPIGERRAFGRFADGGRVKIGLPLLAIALLCTHGFAASAADFDDQMDYTGSYLGGFVEELSGCGPLDGPHEISSIVTVTQADNTSMLIISSQLDGDSCAYGGEYSQLGHLGFLQGYFSCDDGSAGTFSAFEMEKSASGMTGRFTSHGGACSASGRFGGISR